MLVDTWSENIGNTILYTYNIQYIYIYVYTCIHISNMNCVPLAKSERSVPVKDATRHTGWAIACPAIPFASRWLCPGMWRSKGNVLNDEGICFAGWVLEGSKGKQSVPVFVPFLKTKYCNVIVKDKSLHVSLYTKEVGLKNGVGYLNGIWKLLTYRRDPLWMMPRMCFYKIWLAVYKMNSQDDVSISKHTNQFLLYKINDAFDIIWHRESRILTIWAEKLHSFKHGPLDCVCKLQVLGSHEVWMWKKPIHIWKMQGHTNFSTTHGNLFALQMQHHLSDSL